jgi:ketosteroid isomerase-like protein
MGIKENRRLLTDIFAAMAHGDTSRFRAAMAEDFCWIFPGEWSWSGRWESREVVLRDLLGPLMAQFAGTYRSEAELILADGDRVVVQARGHATTLTGEPYEQAYCYVFRVADGRLTEVVEHCDTALVERVLRPPPRPPASP